MAELLELRWYQFGMLMVGGVGAMIAVGWLTAPKHSEQPSRGPSAGSRMKMRRSQPQEQPAINNAEKEALKLLNEAFVLEKSGKTAEAEVLFKNVLAYFETAAPSQSTVICSVLFKLSDLCLSQRKFSDAVQYLTRMVSSIRKSFDRKDEQQFALLIKAGESFTIMKKYTEAEQLYNFISSSYPDYAITFQAKAAQIAAFEGHFQVVNEALPLLERTEPNDASGQYKQYLATSYFDAEYYDEALKLWLELWRSIETLKIEGLSDKRFTLISVNLADLVNCEYQLGKSADAIKHLAELKKFFNYEQFANLVPQPATSRFISTTLVLKQKDTSSSILNGSIVLKESKKPGFGLLIPQGAVMEFLCETDTSPGQVFYKMQVDERFIQTRRYDLPNPEFPFVPVLPSKSNIYLLTIKIYPDSDATAEISTHLQLLRLQNLQTT